MGGLGLACVVANVIAYASPLAVVRQVVRTKSVDSMPLGISVATLLNSMVCLSYALLMGDPWVLIPNACGVVLGVVQLGIYGVYCGRRVAVADNELLACAGRDPREVTITS